MSGLQQYIIYRIDADVKILSSLKFHFFYASMEYLSQGGIASEISNHSVRHPFDGEFVCEFLFVVVPLPLQHYVCNTRYTVSFIK